MSFGVTNTGFVAKPVDDIVTDLEAAFREAFGNSVNVDPASNNGQLIGIMAERLGDLWDGLEAVYNSQYPDSASGTSLDNVCSITGTVRDAPTRSSVTVTLVGDPATEIPAGTIFSVSTTGLQFRTTTVVTLDGSGDGTVSCESVDYGAIIAAAGTLTVIETPVSGLTSVTNALDAVTGQAEEKDSDLRIRRESEVRATGNAAADALRADILEVVGVASCTVFQNDSDVTDGNDVPPHAVECVVLQTDTDTNPVDQDIADVIWASKAAGIETYGDVENTVVDASGENQTIYFSRPDPQTVYISVSVLVDGDVFPATGEADIKQALVDFSNGDLLDAAGTPVFAGYDVGDNVIRSRLYVPIESIAGIADVTALTLGLTASPVGTSNITIGSRELAQFDTSRIVVTVSYL